MRTTVNLPLLDSPIVHCGANSHADGIEGPKEQRDLVLGSVEHGSDHETCAQPQIHYVGKVAAKD